MHLLLHCTTVPPPPLRCRSSMRDANLSANLCVDAPGAGLFAQKPVHFAPARMSRLLVLLLISALDAAHAQLTYPGSGLGLTVQPVVWSLRNGTALTHVVSTRFSLGQGNQTALVEARLQLLFSLCVPAMVQQLRDARLVWLIYYDSTLASEYVAAIAASLQPLAGSGFLVREIVLGQSFYSAQEQLQLAGLWTQPPPGNRVLYLASRLDADDGLPRGAISRSSTP